MHFLYAFKSIFQFILVGIQKSDEMHSLLVHVNSISMHFHAIQKCLYKCIFSMHLNQYFNLFW